MALVGPIYKESSDLSKIEQENGDYPQFIRNFAAGHYMADLPYHLAAKSPPPDFVFCLNENGCIRKYLVKPFSLKKDLFGYLLLPEDRTSGDIKVTFRGTEKLCLGSWVINLEPAGPGSISFDEVKDKIYPFFIQAISEHYGQQTPPLTLGVYGHSQGASLAQLFVTELLARRATTPEFDRIQKINMTALNTPGVSDEIAQQAKQVLLSQIAKKPIKIIANYGIVGGDLVQLLGANMIFADLPPELVEVNLLKIKGFEGYWVKAFQLGDGTKVKDMEHLKALINAAVGIAGGHSNVNFFGTTKGHGRICVDTPYSYLTNKKPEDLPKLRAELNYKLRKTLNWTYYLRYVPYYGWKWCDDLQLFSRCTPSFVYKIIDWAGSRIPKHLTPIYTLDSEGFINPVCPPVPLDSTIPGAEHVNGLCFENNYLNGYKASIKESTVDLTTTSTLQKSLLPSSLK